MWGSSVGGIRERRVAKEAVMKPIRPRILEVKEVKKVKEVKDSEAQAAGVSDMEVDSESEGKLGVG